jgi:hypothetical protein
LAIFLDFLSFDLTNLDHFFHDFFFNTGQNHNFSVQNSPIKETLTTTHPTPQTIAIPKSISVAKGQSDFHLHASEPKT